MGLAAHACALLDCAGTHRGRDATHADGVVCSAGINQFDTDQPPRYVSSTDLSSRVGGLNPRWNGDASAAATDAGFAQAVELTGREFEDAVDYVSKVRRPR